MHRRCLRRLCLLVIATSLLACARHPKNDEEIQKDIQTKAAAEPAIKNSQITVEAKDGKVTLKGTVTTQEARTMLEALAKQEPGVSSLDDQTSVETQVPASSTAAPNPGAESPLLETKRVEPPPPPPPPPKPVIIPAGTVLTVRLGQPLGSKTSPTGTVFSATMANPITIDGKMVIPEDSEATGRVREAKKSGRFKGAAVLGLELTTITVNGHKYNIE